MKKIIFFIILLPSILAIACGNSLTSIGDPTGQTLLSLLGVSLRPGSLQVSSTTPADGSINIARTATITAIFNTEVRCSTITSSSFIISESGTPIAGTVSCTGLTAIFTPAARLLPGTLYTATVDASVQDLENAPMAADHVWSFTTTTAAGGPTVSLTSPANGATNISTDSVITATFSEEVRCSTVTGASFTLDNGGVPVVGTVTCSGTSADFTPTLLLSPNTVYTATVTAAVENLIGDPMAADHVWTFTTTATPNGPQVSSTSPLNGAANVATNTVITANFNEEVLCSTVTSASFTLSDGGPVAGTVSCSGTTAYFTPSALLSPSTIYTATVTTAVENIAGYTIAANHVWTFTTTATPNGPQVNSTGPSNGATNVPVTTIITANFSEEVKCSTVTGASFTLNDGGPVAGTVECAGTTAAFTPSASLSLNTVYTVTITTAVENLDGVPMAANHVWSFTVEPGPSMEQKMRGIWVIGGSSDLFGVNILPQLDLYDPVTNQWYGDVAAAATPSIPAYVPTAFGMAVYMSGKIYIMGGADSSTTVTSRVFVYDIATNAWSTKNPITQARVGSITYTDGTYAYVLSGSNSVTPGAAVGQTTHYRLNPAGAGSWSTLTVLPTAGRVGCGVYNFNGAVSYAGGRLTTVGGAYQTLNDIYQISSNTYSTTQTELALLPAAGKAFMASSGHSGTNGTFLFLAGGISANTLTSVMFFNFTTLTYVPQANSFIVYYMPYVTVAAGRLAGANCPSFGGTTVTGVAFHAGAVSPYNGSTAENPTFYIFGGIRNTAPVQALTVSADVYGISANGTVSGANYIAPGGWVAKTSMPRQRFGHSVVVASP